MNTIVRIGAVTFAALASVAAASTQDAVALQAACARFDRNAAIVGAGQTSARISQDFVGFAGSDMNADRLVAGLARGVPIPLDAAEGVGTRPASTVRFLPPAGPMRYSSVYISLAFAQQELAGLGVTRPAPGDIKAALVGGTVATGGDGGTGRHVTLPGILALRSRGVAWASIAQSQGVSVGAVMKAMNNADYDLSVLHAHKIGAAIAIAMRTAAIEAPEVVGVQRH